MFLFDRLRCLGELSKAFNMTVSELEEIGAEAVESMLVIQSEIHTAEEEDRKQK